VNPSTALGSAAVGALLAMGIMWRRPHEASPWSSTFIAGAGAYRQQAIESEETPGVVRAAAAVAWTAVVVSLARAAGLVLELVSMNVVASTTRGDCATFPCDGYAPPVSFVNTTTMAVDGVYLVAVGALVGALASWALYAPTDAVAARRVGPIVACGVVVGMAVLAVLLEDRRPLAHGAGMAGVSMAHALSVIAAAVSLVLARKRATSEGRRRSSAAVASGPIPLDR